MTSNQLAKGTALTIMAQSLIAIIGILISIILVRFLGAEEYGKLAVILSLISIIEPFIFNGIPLAISKHVAEKADSAKLIFKVGLKAQSIFIFAIVLIIIFMAHPIAKYWLDDKSLIPYIQIAALHLIPLSMFALWTSVLLGLKHFALRSKLQVLRHLFRLIMIDLLLIIFHSLAGAIWGYVSGGILILMIAYFMRIHLEEKPILLSVKSIYYESAPLILGASLTNLIFHLDKIFIKHFLHLNRLVGIYAIASTLTLACRVIAGSLASTLFPSVASSFAKDNIELAKKYIYKGTRYCILILAPFVLVITTTSQDIIPLLFGHIYLAAIPSLKILVLSAVLFALSRIHRQCLIALNCSWFVVKITIISIILDIFLSVILIPKFGLIGAASAIGIVTVINVLINIRKLHRLIQFHFPFKSALKIIITSICLYIAAIYVDNFSFALRYIVYFALGIFYVGILIIWKELNMEDWQVFKKIISRSPIY